MRAHIKWVLQYSRRTKTNSDDLWDFGEGLFTSTSGIILYRKRNFFSGIVVTVGTHTMLFLRVIHRVYTKCKAPVDYERDGRIWTTDATATLSQ